MALAVLRLTTNSKFVAQTQLPTGAIRPLLDRQIASLHAFENFGHAASLDRPVCAKERQRWNRETQRAGDFEIDDERKARRLLDRNIAGF
jgi:hypothetical protein